MITDIAIFLVILIFIMKGAIRGFWASLLHPLATALSLGAAYYHYKTMHNAAIALLIAIAGPIILYLLFKCIGMLIRSPEDQQQPSIISRILGSIITVVWGALIFIPLIYVFTILPNFFASQQPITKDIHQSVIMKPIIDKFKPKPDNNTKPVTLETLVKDPRIQDIANDPEIRKMAQEKDYIGLMKNPKVLEIAKDPELVKRLLEEVKKRQETTTTDLPSNN